MSLLYYKLERLEYADHWDVVLQPKEVEKIGKKLVRHFKLSKIHFSFTNQNWSIARLRHNVIDFPRKDIPLGMLVHELGHFREYQKYGKSNHTKRLDRVTRPIFKYARKFINCCPTEWHGNDVY